MLFIEFWTYKKNEWIILEGLALKDKLHVPSLFICTQIFLISSQNQSICVFSQKVLGQL